MAFPPTLNDDSIYVACFFLAANTSVLKVLKRLKGKSKMDVNYRCTFSSSCQDRSKILLIN